MLRPSQARPPLSNHRACRARSGVNSLCARETRMRSGRRFTSKLLDKWAAQGRGTGAHESFQPWHQVTRSDPGSIGRSHLINGRYSRLHHFLSDKELIAFTFASMLPGLTDVREQFPLALDGGRALSIGIGPTSSVPAPGTLEIAGLHGFRHPTVRGRGCASDWVMTTDLLLTFAGAEPSERHLAISVKPNTELTVRQRQLLQIERAYWQQRHVPWLLITPMQYGRLVATSLWSSAAWAFAGPKISDGLIEAAASYVAGWHRPRLSDVLRSLPALLGVDLPEAQCAFWRATWHGILLLNLATPLRPSSELTLLSREDFWGQNPIAARRSAWND